MEPRIQYARTASGVSIAYSALGSGTPFVQMPLPINHIPQLWKQPEWRPWLESVAGHFRLIQYDGRGMGLSQRNVGDYSLDGHLQDLAAVVDGLGLGRFVLFGPVWLGQVAAAYVAQNPERIAAFVTWAYDPGGRQNAVETLIETNWNFFLESIARTVACVREEHVTDYVEQLRQGCNRDDLVAMSEAANAFEVAPLLSKIRAPTLVLHPSRLTNLPPSVSMELAAEIPGAHLVVIDQASIIPSQEALAAIEPFLTESLVISPASGALPSGTAVILFLDIADSTALTERMGDAAFRGASRALDERLRDAIREAGGTPVEGKVLGDGVMATFASAREAIAAAVRCRELSTESELRLHIGIHAGDVIREPGNVYGGAVNIASRICTMSAPGEILVSDVVRGMARSSAGVAFEDRGEHEMKGVGDPVRVYAVRTGDA